MKDIMHDPAAPNWIGLRTLYMREIRRFSKVYTQTIMAPVVTTLLFLAVFSLALGGAHRVVAGLPFVQFLAPGLIMMAIAQNAFANTSSSIMVSKIQGNIVDILMPPFTAHELWLALVMGGASRGIAVGLAVGVAMTFFVDLGLYAPGYILFHALLASVLLSQLGMIGGIWAEKFDHMAAITNFFITPLAFLSGTFYSIQRLPETFQAIAHFNPFFYMIDGFRYGFFGHADVPIWQSLAWCGGFFVVASAVCLWMLVTGYKIKR